MHNAGVGADVVDGLRLLGLIDIVVVEDIGEGQRLLRVRDWSACHDGQDGLEHTRERYRLDLGIWERQKESSSAQKRARGRRPDGLPFMKQQKLGQDGWGAGIDGGAAVQGGGWGAVFREFSSC